MIDNTNNKIDMSSLKQLLNSHESNDINMYNNNNNEPENIMFNKNKNNNKRKNSSKPNMAKSSSMKYFNNFQKSIIPEIKKTKIVLLKNITQDISNDNSINNKLFNIDEEYKTTPTKQRMNKDKGISMGKISHGASDYNLKIDTNYIDLFSTQSKYGKNKKEKKLSKTTSCEKINIGNNIKFKNTDLDNKLSQWIQKNLMNNNSPKNLKISNNNINNNKVFSKDYSTIDVIGNNRNQNMNFHNNYSTSNLRKLHKTTSMINISSDNNNLKKELIIKNRMNQNFPNILILQLVRNQLS